MRITKRDDIAIFDFQGTIDLHERAASITQVL